MPTKFTIRPATKADCEKLLRLIHNLAVYEKMEDQVVATAEDLRHSLFELRKAEALLAEENGHAVGFALYFENYSTFLGRAGLYLEDLFVEESCRGKGYGKALLARLAAIAMHRGCQRFEWACLDWNTPSIDFYKSLGAISMDGWTTFRLCGPALAEMASQDKETG